MPPSRRAVLLGGGITGTLSAVALRRAGWDVTLLEGAHVGAGSSSRTAAGIRQQFSTRETVVGMRYAVDFYRRWPETMGGPGQPIQQNGYLFLHAEAEAWAAAQARAERQRAWGLDRIEVLAAPELQRRFPWTDPGLLGGVFNPTDGFLRPETVYNEAAEVGRSLGVLLRQNAPVVGQERAGERLGALVLADGERVEGDLFLDCSNAWTRRVGRVLGATPLPVAALKRYLWFLDRAGSLRAEDLLAMPLTISPSGVYCRPENGDSLMCGWIHDAADESETFTYEDQDRIDPEHFHRSGPDSRAFGAWMALAEALPPVGEFSGISATTSGFYATTPDHNPFLDFDPAVPNLIRLVGFSGHGAMFGPFTAAVAAALAENGRSLDAIELPTGRAELAPFRIGRDFSHAESMVI